VIGQKERDPANCPLCAHVSAGLAPGRPLVCFFAGPTGTGKTRTVEALARRCTAARSSAEGDCGEFQMEPKWQADRRAAGYWGIAKRSRMPRSRNWAGGERIVSLALVLVDEIEKRREHDPLLLGVLDKAILRWRNTTVNFEAPMIS